MDAALLILGCSVFVVLGLGHAALVLFTTKFEPRDRELLEKLKSGRTGMSKTGNMWDGIRGFHLAIVLAWLFMVAFILLWHWRTTVC